MIKWTTASWPLISYKWNAKLKSSDDFRRRKKARTQLTDVRNNNLVAFQIMNFFFYTQYRGFSAVTGLTLVTICNIFISLDVMFVIIRPSIIVIFQTIFFSPFVIRFNWKFFNFFQRFRLSCKKNARFWYFRFLLR